MFDINVIIGELVRYSLEKNIIKKVDEAWATASLMQVFGIDSYKQVALPESRPLCDILADALDYAYDVGLIESRGVVSRDLFGSIKSALEGSGYSTPTIEMLINAALKQLRYAISDKGEEVAIPESRKQIALYLKGFRGAARIRTAINMAKTFSEVEAALLSAIGNE